MYQMTGIDAAASDNMSMLSTIDMPSNRPMLGLALQLTGFAQPLELPLSLTKLVLQSAASSDRPLAAASQPADMSACVRQLTGLRHLAIYSVDLRLQSEALFAAASGLPHLRSLHLVQRA
jgi:hypothetical protein